MGAADEIAKAKALLDAGTISAAEYERLKAAALRNVPGHRSSPAAVRFNSLVGLVVIGVFAALLWIGTAKNPRAPASPEPSHGTAFDYRKNPDGSIYAPRIWPLGKKLCDERRRALIADDAWDVNADVDTARFNLPRRMWAEWSLHQRVSVVKLFECSFAPRDQPVDRMTIADEADVTVATLNLGTIIFGD